MPLGRSHRQVGRVATIDLRPSWGAITRLSRSGKTPRHPVTSGCRGAPVACAARERPLTVARKDDRVRNLAGFEGIGGVRAALVGIPGRAVSSTSTRRKHAVGGWSPEHRPRRRDRPQRRGRPGGRHCPHRSPAWRPRSTPAVQCAAGRVRKGVGALFAQCGRRLAGLDRHGASVSSYGYGRVC